MTGDELRAPEFSSSNGNFGLYDVFVSFCTEITASLPAAWSGQQIQKRCGTIALGLTSEDRPEF